MRRCADMSPQATVTQRPQSSPAHLYPTGRLPPAIKVPASELAKNIGAPRRPVTRSDPNKASERSSRSPKALRLKPRPQTAQDSRNRPHTAQDSRKPPQPPPHSADRRKQPPSPSAYEFLGSGVFLAKSPEKIHVTLKTDLPGQTTLESVRGTPVDMRERVAQLEAQVERLEGELGDMTGRYEEERVAHNLTKQSANDVLNSHVRDLKESHLDAMLDLQRETSYQLDSQRRRYENSIEAIKQDCANRLDDKCEQLDTVERAFEAYKANIQAEVEARMLELERSLREEAGKERLAALAEQKGRLDRERGDEVDKLTKSHNHQMALLIAEKDRERNELVKSFTEAAQDMNKFHDVMQELEQVKADYENVMIETRALRREIKNKQNELLLEQLKVRDFESNFAEKVRRVEERFWERAESLMRDNRDIKRRYNHKCSQLFHFKASQLSVERQKAYSASETMAALVESRLKAGARINVSDLSLDGQPRRPFTRSLSQPITVREERHASLSAGQVRSSSLSDLAHTKGSTSATRGKDKRRPKSSSARLP